MRRGAAVLALFLTFTVSPASPAAADPRLVRDFNTTVSPEGSDPRFWTTIGDLTFFMAHDGRHDMLWVSDGTAAGTHTAGASLHQRVTGYLGRLGNSVVYSGVLHDGSNGIFASDGSFSGTRYLAHGAGGYPLGTYRDVTYFVASTSDTGEELWRTDGTPEGTFVVDLYPGERSSSPGLMLVAGDTMLFFATTPENYGWHRSDGTVAGTTLLSRGGAFSIGLAGNKVIALRDGGPTTQYWVSDGTAGGTMRLADTPDTNSRATVLGTIGSRVLFTRAGADGSWDVWSTDGTIAGTTFVFDTPPGAQQVFRGTVVGERIFFFAREDGGSALYVTDGTGPGTARVRWFEEPTSIFGRESGGAYLFALHGESERTLWRSDGTGSGTTQVAVIGQRSYASYILALASRAGPALFTGHDPQHGDELWITDGTPAGTRLLANLRPERQNWGEPFGLATDGSRLFLQAREGTTRGLYVVENGVPARIADSQHGSSRGPVFSGGLYYFTQGIAPDVELWRTDGTAAGTFRLHAVGESRNIDLMLPFKGGLLFQGQDSQQGAEPWFTDGTVAGTRMLADTDPSGLGFIYPSAVIRADGTAALLSAGKIWLTDGTTTTAVPSATPSPDGDITPGSPLAEMGGVIYALDDMHSNAFGLWRSDGVESRRVVEIQGSSVRRGWLWSTGTRLFFLATDAVWTSDGTQAGTHMLRHVSPATCSPPDPPPSILVNGVFYWYGGGMLGGLWRSDGTVEGTFALAGFPTGGYVCDGHLAAVGDTVYFRGADEATGFELWRTDGMVRGTRMVADLEPGPGDSDPRELTLVGEELYFVATTSAVGQELFVLSTRDRERRRSVRH